MNTTNNFVQIQFVSTFGQSGPTGVLEVDPSVQFSIDFAISDVKDPFSRQGTRSYNFKVLGTKENNKLLNNYYNINVVNGEYSYNKRQRVVVLRNGTIILDNAYMQLLSIDKSSPSDAFSDELINYNFIVGDDTTSFFTDITNKYLTDLDFSDYDHVYNSTNVIASFTHSSISDGYKYVLPYIDNDNEYNLEECRPAISVYQYFNRIHAAAGYQWDWTGFDLDTIRMDRLWIPYNGDKPKMHEQEIYEVASEKIIAYSQSNLSVPAGNIGKIAPELEALEWEHKDLNGDYNPATGIYTSSINSGVGAIDVYFDVTYSFELYNYHTSTSYLYLQSGYGSTLNFLPASADYRPEIGLYNITTNSYQSVIIDSIHLDSPVSSRYSLVPGWNTIKSSTTIRTNQLPVTNISVGDQLSVFTKSSETHVGASMWSKSSLSPQPISVGLRMTITNIQMILIPRVDTYGFGAQLIMNDFIPLKIKQSDFIKSIANMYNLIIDLDDTNDKKIIYKQRDTYFDAGATKNWTRKIDTKKTSSIKPISNANKKKIILTYKEDKDIANVEYTTATKEIYGQLEYILENENIKDVEKKEIIFSPSPIAKTIFGSYNPIWAGAMPKTNIRILLDGGTASTTATYSIIDYGTQSTGWVGSFNLSVYPMLTHFDNPDTPQFDINFGLCDSYLYDGSSNTNNNLYHMYWRRTIAQIDTGRILTAYFNLNEYDIATMRLNDKIYVKDTWYNINKLQYDINSNGPTKVELMTIDDNLKLPKIRTSVFISRGTPMLSTLLNKVDAIRNDSLNNIYSGDSVVVKGKRVTVSADTKNALVLGNDITNVESNTIYSENINTTNLYVDNITIGSASFTSLGLPEVLAVNNNSGTYSIIMGSGSSISSENGVGKIELDSGGTPGYVLISSTDGLFDSHISLDNNDVTIKSANNSINLLDTYGFKTVYNSIYYQTTNATVTYIKQIIIPSNKILTIKTITSAIGTASALGSLGFATYKNISGVLSLVSSADIITKTDFSSAYFTFSQIGTAVNIEIVGEIGKTIDWNSRLEYMIS